MISSIDRKTAILFGLGFLFFFFLGLGSYDLSAPDEPRFALVAREMIDDGRWLLPHRNQQAYPDKPPLFFWSIAGFSLLNGGDVNNWTARLPSAFAATFALLLTYFWALDPKRKRLGWLTAIILISSVKFFFQARIAQIDMTLCLCTTAALIFGYRHFQGEQKKQFLIGLCLGLGILAKGPVGYLIPAGAFCLYAAVNKQWKSFPKAALLWGLLPPLLWISGLIIEVAITNQWAYLENLLFKQTVVRYFNAWHHHKPFYYFIQTLVHDFFPWSFLLFFAIPFKKFKELDERSKFAWCVVIFTLVFFSLSKGKRNLYILPLYPFAAYIVAAFIDKAIRTGLKLRPVKIAMVIPMIFLQCVGGPLFFFASGFFPISAIDHITTPVPALAIQIAALLLVVGSIVGYFMISRNQMEKAVFSLTGQMLVLCSLVYLVIIPWLTPFRSAKIFTEQASQLIDQNPASVAMVHYRSAYVYYGKHNLVELRTKEGLHRPHLPTIHNYWNEHPEGWLIIRREHYDEYPELAQNCAIHLERIVGRGQTMMLIKPLEKKAEADHNQAQ